MSLINDVLRELDEGTVKKVSLSKPEGVYGGLGIKKRGIKGKKPFQWAIAFVIFSSLVAILWFFSAKYVRSQGVPGHSRLVSEKSRLVSPNDRGLPIKDKLTTSHAKSGLIVSNGITDQVGGGKISIVKVPGDELDKSYKLTNRFEKNSFKSKEVKSIINYTDMLIVKGKYVSAIEFLNSATVRAIKSSEIDGQLAKLYLRTEEFSSAMKSINKALDNNVNSVPLILVKARILFRENKFKQSLSVLMQQSPQLSGNADYYSLMARLYLQLNKPEIAKSIYQQLLALDPSKSLWWLGLGVSLDSMHDSRSAKDAYARAIQIGGLNPGIIGYIQSRVQ